MEQSNEVILNTEVVIDEMSQRQFDEAALAQQYRKRLVAMLTRLTKDPDRAEDLAQDALIIVINKLREGGIREPEKLSAYIYSTARFLYFGWLRKKDNKVELTDNLENFETSAPTPENTLEMDETAREVAISIEQLNIPRDREILTRSYIREQSKEEICNALLLSAEHFDRVISRARKRLHKVVSNRLMDWS